MTKADNRQKNWVRSWLNENYLFYRDAPLTSIDPDRPASISGPVVSGLLRRAEDGGRDVPFVACHEEPPKRERGPAPLEPDPARVE